MKIEAPAITVGIPTYKRPKGLRKLLKALEASTYKGPINVCIVDNDPDLRQGTLCSNEIIREGYKYPLEVIEIPTNGISEARNALISAFLRKEDSSMLCMLDDDEWPSDNWLTEIVNLQEATHADIIGGHVERVFEVEMPAELLDYNTISKRYATSGVVRSIEATSNIAFSSKWLREWPQEFFNPQFSKTGGGDKELLLRMRLAGARFAWSNEALVYETFPASRSTRAWALQRAYRVGNSEMIAYNRVKPPLYWAKEATKITIALCNAVLAHTIFYNSPVRKFRGRIAAERARGKLAAIIGHRYFEYTQVHGN